MTTLLIARLTFDEALRRKMIWAVLLLSGIFLALYAFGFQILRDDLSSSIVSAAARRMLPCPTRSRPARW
jgi:hypothetical protein